MYKYIERVSRRIACILGLMLFLHTVAAAQSADSLFIAADSSITQADSVTLCSSLKHVISSSKVAFKNDKDAVKEERNDFFGRMVVYNARTRLPGAISTQIVHNITHTYISVMDTAHSNSQDISTHYDLLVLTLRECLGATYKYTETANSEEGEKIFKAQANSGTTNDFYEPNISLKLEKMQNIYQLSLEVNEPFFKLK